MSVPTSVNEVVELARGLLYSLIRSIITAVMDQISAALQPLSFAGKMGVLIGVVTLSLGGIKAYRQGYEGRMGQPLALGGFVSGILVIYDFLPPLVGEAVVVFVGVAGMASVVNLSSYFAGATESSEWYQMNRWVWGSIPLAILLLLLVLEYVVGVDLPLLP